MTGPQSRLGFFAPAVALLALGVAAWALVQTQSPPAGDLGPGARASIDAALERLETRLAALEAARLRDREDPILEASVLARLDELERRLTAAAPSPDAAEPTEAPLPDAKPEAGADPGPDDVERFKKLQAAARRQERDRRNARRIDRVLDELGIALTDEQRTRLVETYGEFEGRRNEIWGEAKRSGAAEGEAVDWESIIRETSRVIEAEFTERISDFVPGSDAEAISRGLNVSGK